MVKARGFIFQLFLINITLAQVDPRCLIPHFYRFNLHSDERYTKYLPERLGELKKICIKNGLDAALSFVRDDCDLESDLFIISLEKPEKLLVYSHQPQLNNKTAEELQNLIFSSPGLDKRCDVSTIFKYLLSTAQKGDTYRPYFWRFNNKEDIKIQVAYVSLISHDNKNYIIGSAVFVKNVPDHIILPHRLQTGLAQLKKGGIKSLFNLMHNDPDELYYFAIQMEPPYRKVANGGNEKLAGFTAEMEEDMIFAQGIDRTVNMVKTFQELVHQARRGGGYVSYAWHIRPEEPVKIKVAYSLPFSYKKQKILLGTGYAPLGFPDSLRIALPNRVDQIIHLAKEVGLENTVSELKKNNTKKLYGFIIEANYPYRIVAHLYKKFVGKYASEITDDIRGKKNTTNFERVYSDMVRFIKTGGGYYAYEDQVAGEDSHILRLAYINRTYARAPRILPKI